MNITSILIVPHRFGSVCIVITERDRRRAGGPVSFHPRIFICSKIVVTVVNLISHKPRFHAGLLAIRQSSGFIVGNSSTSRMESLLVRSITRRSTPKPRPPVGGIPYSSALMKS